MFEIQNQTLLYSVCQTAEMTNADVLNIIYYINITQVVLKLVYSILNIKMYSKIIYNYYLLFNK